MSKQVSLTISFDYERTLSEEILREVYDPRVEQMLKMKEHQKRIQGIFSGFNFDLIRVSTLEIIIVLLKTPDVAKAFERYLLDLKFISTKDSDLIIHLLCQTGFSNEKLFAKLKQNKSMQKIIDAFMQSSLSEDDPGYYGLPSTS